MARAPAAVRSAPPRERGTLDRETIVRTALDLLGETGIDGLSTRRLAAELGIKSASLYWHFKDKNELLNEMSGMMFDACLPLPADTPGFDWAEWLAHGARSIRNQALSRRDGAQVMARPRPKAPNARVKFEENVKLLERYGFTAQEAALTMQALRRYAIGAALQEQSTPNAPPGVIELTGEKGFEYGLQLLLVGLRQKLAERGKAKKR
jgi:TetR/AcrR family tetracycline transcriptional repressor